MSEKNIIKHACQHNAANEYTACWLADIDIAWHTLARMLSKDPPLKKKRFAENRHKGILNCWHNCGRFFIQNKCT